jgi:hypothetical protein
MSDVPSAAPRLAECPTRRRRSSTKVEPPCGLNQKEQQAQAAPRRPSGRSLSSGVIHDVLVERRRVIS